jgi:NADPH-dependent curcumin reductase CurA
VQSGEIIFEETIVDGFEQLPTALNSLFTGEHRGKLLVKV